jgi:hypothetical protein
MKVSLVERNAHVGDDGNSAESIEQRLLQNRHPNMNSMLIFIP